MADLKLKEIETLRYERPAIKRGYANQTLSVNLSGSKISIKPVSEKMKETFVGGKGFDLWLLWNAVNSDTRWNSPENAICIACGPLGGTPIYPGSGKSIVTAISPTTGSVMDSNVGGFFGPYLNSLVSMPWKFRVKPKRPRSSLSTASISRYRYWK